MKMEKQFKTSKFWWKTAELSFILPFMLAFIHIFSFY